MDSISENQVRDMLINPYYATVLDETLFADHKVELAVEDWVVKNSALFNKLGPEKFLSDMLNGLSSGTFSVAVSPIHAINVSKRLNGEHKLLISQIQWIEANAKLAKELGKDEWLWRFVSVLESGGPKT